MNKTDIEYLDYTYNPIRMTCTPVSEGCKNCWHRRYRVRFPHEGKPELNIKELEAPLRLKKPSIIGVQFNGDLFHEEIEYEIILEILGIVRNCEQHDFVVLTKRPERMKEWARMTRHIAELPNLALGISVEDQKTADERIPILLQTPAAVRVVSYELALGEVDFTKLVIGRQFPEGKPEPYYLNGLKQNYLCMYDGDFEFEKINWIIAGKETGISARPCDLDWMRSVRDQCQSAGVPFFYKNGLLDGKKHEEYPNDPERKE